MIDFTPAFIAAINGKTLYRQGRAELYGLTEEIWLLQRQVRSAA